jgi:hypothetical protein
MRQTAAIKANHQQQHNVPKIFIALIGCKALKILAVNQKQHLKDLRQRSKNHRKTRFKCAKVKQISSMILNLV